MIFAIVLLGLASSAASSVEELPVVRALDPGSHFVRVGSIDDDLGLDLFRFTDVPFSRDSGRSFFGVITEKRYLGASVESSLFFALSEEEYHRECRHNSSCSPKFMLRDGRGPKSGASEERCLYALWWNNLEDVETSCKFGRVRSLHGAGAFHLGGNRYAFLSSFDGGEGEEEEEEGVIAVTCPERSSKLPLFYFPPDGAASFEVELPEGCSVEVPGGQFVSRQGGFEEPETHVVAAFPRLTEASTKDLCWLALNGPATFAQLDEARREQEEDFQYVLFLGLVVLGALAVFAAAAVLNSKLEERERKRINREIIEANS